MMTPAPRARIAPLSLYINTKQKHKYVYRISINIQSTFVTVVTCGKKLYSVILYINLDVTTTLFHTAVSQGAESSPPTISNLGKLHDFHVQSCSSKIHKTYFTPP